MINYLINFVTDPMTQLLFWGGIVIYTTMYCVVRYLNHPEAPQRYWQMVSAFWLICSWMTNVIMWFTHTLSWVIVTDFVYFTIAVIMMAFSQYRWMGIIALLYGICLGLDLWLINGAKSMYYAIASNIVFGGLIFSILKGPKLFQTK